MKCLILAAGRGSRLSDRGEPKPLVTLLGLPLIERAIVSAQKAGIEEFIVVTGYMEEALKAGLAPIARTRGVTITTLSNPNWQGGNATSVAAAAEALGSEERFLLLMADHLFEPSILRALMDYRLPDGSICLATDHRLNNPLIDPSDVTRVLTDDGSRIRAIGKGLKEYNCFDTGIFLCTPSIFDAIKESIEQHGDGSLSGAVYVLAQRGRALSMDIGNRFWIDVDDPAAFRRAEQSLLDGLKKPTDGPVARLINRPISIAITRRIVDSPISPNQISLFCFGLSLVAALFMAQKGYIMLLLGGLIAQAASIIDGCDGEVARLKHLESHYGGWLDAVLDRYSDGFLLAALTWHLYAEDSSPTTLFTGFMAIMGSFMVSYTADKYDNLIRRRLLKGRSTPFRIGRDIRVFIVFLGAVFNMVFAALFITALLMNLETLRRLIICRD